MDDRESGFCKNSFIVCSYGDCDTICIGSDDKCGMCTVNISSTDNANHSNLKQLVLDFSGDNKPRPKTHHSKRNKAKAKDKYNHKFNSFWRQSKSNRYF
jgi:hypothetical protein